MRNVYCLYVGLLINTEFACTLLILIRIYQVRYLCFNRLHITYLLARLGCTCVKTVTTEGIVSGGTNMAVGTTICE
jgi:hypothetical protein